MSSFSVVNARSAELSILDVSARPRIVKHAKTCHLRGPLGISVCPSQFSNLSNLSVFSSRLADKYTSASL